MLKKPHQQSYNPDSTNKLRFVKKKRIFGFKLDFFMNDMLK